jgi:hypothetical protein
MARSRRTPAVACWQVLFRAFRPQTTRKINKVTSSERSASQIYRKQRALWRGVEEPVLSVAEGTPATLPGGCSWGAFRPQTTTEVKKVTNSEQAMWIIIIIHIQD